MQAEPSQDARADQPTETIVMFTIRGPDQRDFAAQVCASVKGIKGVQDWTQTTRVIPTEADREQSETKTRHLLLDNRGRTPKVECSQNMTPEEADWRNRHVPRPAWCSRWLPVPVKGGQGEPNIVEPSHGPALSPRGHDFVELLDCFRYLAKVLVGTLPTLALALFLYLVCYWFGWTQ